MDSPYREHADPVELRRDRFVRRRRRAIARIGPELYAIRGRRLARLAAGVTATAWAVILFGVAIHAMVSAGRVPAPSHGTLTVLLLAGWGAVVVSWAVVRASAGRGIAARLHDWVQPTDSPEADLARFQRDELRLVREEVDGLEEASLAAPLAGAAMLLPLTLHFFVHVLVFARGADRWPQIDRWIESSVVLAGHAHVVFAALCWRYVRRLRGGDLVGSPTSEGLGALGVAAAAAVLPFPGTVLAVIATGAFVAPLLFAAARSVALRERGVLGITPKPGEAAPGEGTGALMGTRTRGGEVAGVGQVSTASAVVVDWSRHGGGG